VSGAMDTVARLQRLDGFSHCETTLVRRLAELGTLLESPSGQLVFGEGEPGGDLYVLLDGSGLARRRTPFGELKIAAFPAGSIVGEVSLLDGKPRSTTFVLEDAAQLLCVEADGLRQAFEADACFAVGILRLLWHALSAKVRSANAVMLEIMSEGAAVSHAGRAADGEKVALSDSAKRVFLQLLGLDESELQELTAHARAERFPAEGLIFSEGDRGDAIYVVHEGKVRISRRPPGMGEEALAILSRGEVFGEMALVDDRTRSADARAHQAECTVLVLDRGDLEAAFAASPQVGRQFLTLMCKILCRRLRVMTDQLVAWKVMSGFG
jgi:CRP/FNR family transcriptional regulator, cyclic AMP receptor protein